MAYRFPRSFTLTKAAILAALIIASQVVPHTVLSGDGTPADMMGKKAGMWHAMIEDCPTRMDATTADASGDQLI